MKEMPGSVASGTLCISLSVLRQAPSCCIVQVMQLKCVYIRMRLHAYVHTILPMSLQF